MTNWNDYSMKPKMPLGTVPLPTTPQPMPAPTPAPTSGHPGGLLGGILSGIGQMGGIGIQSQQNPMNFIGGLLGNLFGHNKAPEPAKPNRQIIDKRPDDIQSLVSMFANKE